MDASFIRKVALSARYWQSLFLHYTFDKWMARHKPQIPFERYADDIVCHCKNEGEVNALKEALNKRFNSRKLTLHPTKTQIIYCKDEDCSKISILSSITTFLYKRLTSKSLAI